MINKISINEHSSIRIDNGKVIYFDPFRIKKETHDADIIFVTHSHFDHYSIEDINKVIKDDTVLVFPLAMEKDAEEYTSKYHVEFMQPNEKMVINSIIVESVHSYNVNKPMHPRSNGWLGYIITLDGTRIYVCGDTDLNDDILKIDCDIILVPVGGTYTMNALEAADLVNEIKPKIAIPTHYGTLVGEEKFGDEFASYVNKKIKVIKKIEF